VSNYELRLYYLTAAASWPVTRSDVDHFFSPKADDMSGLLSGIKTITIHASDAFVTLQVSDDRIYRVGTGGRVRNYRHFVYKWAEDFSVIQTEELGSQIQLHNPEDRHSVRLTVFDDMVNIDRSTRSDRDKQVYQYLETHWKRDVFPHDSLQNNYIGPSSFSTTQNGQAQFWELNCDEGRWEAKFPPYTDGNPTFWEKVWETFFTIEWILTLPLAEVGFLIDIAAFALDLVISAAHEQGVSNDRQGRFFTGDNIVYHKNSDGSWIKIGELLTSGEQEAIEIGRVRIPGWDVHEQYRKQSLDSQSTQNAQDFIAFVIKQDQYTEQHQGGYSHGSDPGFPKYVGKIQLLKNGQLLRRADLDDGESVKRSVDDETNIVGHNAFVAYKGGSSLRRATSLVIHRVINDGIKGALKDYAVSRVTVNDGY
jgi:hypothetical protein